MNKRFSDAFTNTGTVHGGEHRHEHHADGSTTTTSAENGRTRTRTRYTDPQAAFDAMVRAEGEKKKRR
jgi:hypothetical protein